MRFQEENGEGCFEQKLEKNESLGCGGFSWAVCGG